MVVAARTAGIDVTVCGEMGHDPAFAPFLIGIGLRRFSVDPRYLPTLQALIGDLHIDAAERYGAELLAAPSIAAVETIVEKWRFTERYPEAS